MRHRRKGRRLGRTSAHRKALKKNLLKSLFEKGQVVTTQAKAKEFAPAAEKLITLAKRGFAKAEAAEQKILAEHSGEVTPGVQAEIEEEKANIRLAYFRRVLAEVQDKKTAEKVFFEIAPSYMNRQGGYTRVVRVGKRRIGDNAPLALLGLVEGENIELSLPSEDVKEKKKQAKEKLKQQKADKKRKERERKEREKEKERIRKEKEKKRLEKEKELKRQSKKKKK